MVKQTITTIIIILIGHLVFGQDTTSSQKNEVLLFTDHQHDNQLKTFLAINESVIRLRCHPKIHTDIIDSLNLKTCQIIDSINVTNYLKSDSTWIYLKNSYSWNIDNELPKISMNKYIFKNQDKLTEDEKKILHYMIFYSNRYYEAIDKFTYYQYYVVDYRLFQFRFDCFFDDKNDRNIKLTEFKEMKN